MDYCRAHRVRCDSLWAGPLLTAWLLCVGQTFVVSVEEDTALFVNSAINRKLNLEARRVVLAALVEDGRAQWLGPQRCLVHWRSPQEWGASIYGWATAHGLEGGVTTLNELAHGEDTQGQGAWIHLYTYGIVSATAGIMLTSRWAWMPPDFHGIQADALAAALKCLELDGKAKCVSVESPAGPCCSVRCATQPRPAHVCQGVHWRRRRRPGRQVLRLQVTRRPRHHRCHWRQRLEQVMQKKKAVAGSSALRVWAVV